MENGRKVTVILDSSLHGMRLLYGCKKEDTPEEAFQLWRYYFLNGIFQYIEKFKADEFILILDSGDNWRKDVFEFYKGDRKIKRKASDDDEETWFTFKKYYEEYERLMNDIANNLPIKIVQVHRTEADDIAGVLCNSDQLKDNTKVLVTRDGDYVQLLSCPLTKLYNPVKNEYVTCDDPKKELMRKIMLGDTGDYVPSIKDRHIFKPEFLEFCVAEGVAKNESNAKIKLESDESLLIGKELEFLAKYGIKASRVMKFSKKTVNSLIEEEKINEFLQQDENKVHKKNFIRNNKLVNLTAQPKEIKEEIEDAYRNCELTVGMEKLFDFFITNSFNEFMGDTTRIGKLLEPLCDNINK